MSPRLTRVNLLWSTLNNHSLGRLFLSLVIAFVFSVQTQAQEQCPDLSSFYPESSSPDWDSVKQRLDPLFESCLISSEYFALYGAAQLNTGDLDRAMESLERALLLNPDNGAAMFDYAQALSQDGQIFAAIEADQLLLDREDLPAPLESRIQERQRSLRGLTQQTFWQIDVLGGYDDNLNGAPDQDLITLTLSGESVLLGLSPEFQAINGPFLNVRLLGNHQRLSPNNRHNFIGELRGRISEDSNSDLIQLSGRYNLVRTASDSRWQINTGINNLLFGGDPLFTGTDASFRYQFSNDGSCRPYYGGALQYQLYHNQSQLNGLEGKLGIGTNCAVFGATNQRINAEASVLHNEELKQDRLGGSRDGWQLVLDWQFALQRGVFAQQGVLAAQFNHTRIKDHRGFSPLLADNARRDIERSSFLLQYRENLPLLSPGAQLLVNFYHQNQASNLELFSTEDTSLEIGISWRF